MLPGVSLDSINNNIIVSLPDKENILIQTKIDRRTVQAYITLNYTKTTD